MADLKLDVLLQAIDKMTAPARSALSSITQLSTGVQQAEKKINNLNEAQRNIDGLRSLAQKIEQTNLKVSQSQKALSSLEAEIKNTNRPTKTMLRQQEQLTRSHKKLVQKEEIQQQTLENRKIALKAAGIEVSNLNAAEHTIHQQIEKNTKTFNRQAPAIEKTRREIHELNKTQKKLNSFTRLKNQLDNTQTAYQYQQKELTRLQTAFDNTDKPTKKLQNNIRAATERLERLGLVEQQQQQNLTRLGNSLNQAGYSTNKLSDAQRTLQQNTVSANAALNRQAEQLRQTRARQAQAAQARQKMDRSLQTLSDVSLIAGPGMQVGKGMVNIATAPMKTAMDFEKEMSKVAALTRLKKTDKQYGVLEKQSRHLGATTAFSAVDVAQGQQFMAMAGFDSKQIVGAMPGVLDLATASGKDLARVADISSNILSGFGLEAEQMGRVGDVLTATFTRTNVDLGMLGYSMKYASPIARQLGVSLEETAAMSGLLGNVGIQGSQAGTTLRGVFNRLAAQPKPVANALYDLGIKAKDSQNNLRPIIDILAEVAEKTENLGSADRLAYFKDIAGMEAGSGFAELVTQQGAEAISKFTKVLKNSKGEVRQVAKVMSENLAGDFTNLSSAVQDAQISMGYIFLPTLREIVQKIIGVVRETGKWIQENPELVAKLTKVVLAVGGFIAIMGGLSLALVAVLGPLALMRFALRMTLLQLAPIAAGIKLFASSLFMLATRAIPIAVMALRTLSIAMIANPIGIAIAAIVAAVVVLIYHWKKVKAFFSGFWTGLKSSFIEPFSGLLPNISKRFKQALLPLKKAFKPLIPLFKWFGEKYQQVKKWLKNLFGATNDIKKSGESIGAAIGTWLLKPIVTGIYEAINLIAKVVEWIAPKIAAGIEAIAPIIKMLPALFKMSFEAIKVMIDLFTPIGIIKRWGEFRAWWDSWTIRDIGFGVGVFLRQAADKIIEKWNQLKAWWDSWTLKDLFIGGNFSVFNLGKQLGEQFKTWWNSWSLKDLKPRGNWSVFKHGKKAAEKFRNWWNGFKLKTLTAKINQPRQAGFIARAGASFAQSVKAGWKSGGARASGGAVTPGNFYRVNEQGPELLTMAGRSYLMASNAGKVVPVGNKLSAALAGGAMAASLSMPAAAINTTPVSQQQSTSYHHPTQNHNQNITININAPAGVDEYQIAELLEQKLREIQRDNERNSRGQLYDGD